MRSSSLLLVLPLLTFCACADDPGAGPSSGTQPEPTELFSPSVKKLVIEVDYQAGAEPYTGGSGLMKEPWQITEANLARLFLRAPKATTLPRTLPEMQLLADVSGTSFTSAEILAIAAAHRDRVNTADTATFYVLFLDGYFRDDDGVNMNVLGVSLGSSGVLAMFKPVIESTDGIIGGVARYVEQSTLVHELGHAAGLVDNGIPLASAHHDSAHGAHCTNDRCVMYWANEGAASAASFVQKTLMTGATVIYAEECLADADALNP